MPELSEDDLKYCQGQSCKDLTEGRLAVKICHHSDCQERNSMTPFLLCEDCDRDIHTGTTTPHLRFDLPKTLRRTPSLKSNNSDSGTEDDSDPRFDKKYRSYASARKFFNLSSGSKKKARRHNTDDPSREFISIRFYQPDGSYKVEIAPALTGKSLKESIEHMFENRNLSFDTHSVFLEASNTPLPLAFDTFPLGGNVLHVRAINEMKVDERIIAMAKQERDEIEKKSAFPPSRKDSVNKVYSSQRLRKNIMAYLGEEEPKSSTVSPESSNVAKAKMPQRRSGIFQGPRLRDVNRSFQDVLDFFKVHGIENSFGTQEGKVLDDEDFFQVEDSWTMVISHSPDMPKKLRDQQEAIWELLTTEISYLSKLRVIIKLFLVCLKGLQGEKHLTEVDQEKLFGNIIQVYKANVEFWKKYLLPVVEKARREKQPLLPDVLHRGFSTFAEIFFPYIQHCAEENHCLQYLKLKTKESEKFREYLEWCENHKLCNRLKLRDLLVKPMQRVTKYPLLLKAILKKTQEEDQHEKLKDVISKVEAFVGKVNTTVRIRQERKKLLDVISRIDIYTPVDPVNDEVEKVLLDHCILNLEGSVPGLAENEHRCVLKDGPMKLTEKQGRSDIYVFLFTDMFLITKLKRGLDKYRVIKQPFRLSKVILHPLRDSSGFVFMYLNEYNVLANAFVLSCGSSPSDQQDWLQAIEMAKERYVSARLGQGSTYDFFDDSALLPFQPSPQISPQVNRKLPISTGTRNDLGRSISAELATSKLGNDFIIMKTRAASNIEHKSNSTPSVNDATVHKTDNRVVRSRSDPKSEKNPRIVSVAEKGKGSIRQDSSFWDSMRPASMVADPSSSDFSMSSIIEERRSRSESLPVEAEEESFRKESFRSTKSDTALSHEGENSKKVFKGSSSAPTINSGDENSSDNVALNRVVNFTSDDNSNSSLSLSSENHVREDSIYSSNVSVSIEQSPSENALHLVDTQRQILKTADICTELNNGVPAFETLDEHSDLKESSVDDTSLIFFAKEPADPNFRQIEVPSILSVNAAVQTDFHEVLKTSVGIQCDKNDLFGANDAHSSCSYDPTRLKMINSLLGGTCDESYVEAENRLSNQFVYVRNRLRHSMSETDIFSSNPTTSNSFAHCRSFSDDLQPGTLQVKSMPSSPKASKRNPEGRGMRALQVLAQSLEASIHNRSKSLGARPQQNVSNIPKGLKIGNSLKSLRQFAILNASPKMDKTLTTENTVKSKLGSNCTKQPSTLAKHSKRATWHADTISEFENFQKGLANTKDPLQNDTILGGKDNENKGKRSPNDRKVRSLDRSADHRAVRKPGGKRWTIGEGDVVSGPNLDKRGIRKHFLEESLMFGPPEYV